MKKYILAFVFMIMLSINTFAAAESIDSNKYFTITDKYEYTDCINYTHIVWIVNPKQTCSISITGIAYDKSGNVVDKLYSSVSCVDKEENFIEFIIKPDIQIAKVDWKYKVDTNPWLHNKNNDDSIIIENYNKVEDDLYISVKQIKEKHNSFAKLKMLFFKNNKLIDSDEGYFSIYAENLDSINSTDVMEFWIYGTDFDDVKFYYEWY